MFIDKCNKKKLIPEPFIVQYFVENRRVMDFSNCSLRDNVVLVVADTLYDYSINAKRLDKEPLRIEILNLRNNHIMGNSICSLSKFIQESKSLIQLDLSHNTIHVSGMNHLCNALQIDKQLVSLLLENNKLNTSCCKLLGNMLKSNNSIKELNLRSNMINATTIKYICNGLEENKCLEKLDLSWNVLQTKGCYHVLKALEINNTIKYINFRYNGIGSLNRTDMINVIGAFEHIFTDKYKKLELVDLSYNKISFEDTKKIANHLQHSDKMRCLHLNNNDNTIDYNILRKEDKNKIKSQEQENVKEDEFDFYNNKIQKSFCGTLERNSTFLFSRYTGCVNVEEYWMECDKCWIGENYIPITFTFTPGFTGPYCDKIEILFEFEKWKPRVMEFNGTGNRSGKRKFLTEAKTTVMIPRGSVVNYLFRADDQFVFYGVDHQTHWSTLNYLHTLEKYSSPKEDSEESKPHTLQVKTFSNRLIFKNNSNNRLKNYAINRIFIPEHPKHSVWTYPMNVIIPLAYDKIDIDEVESHTSSNQIHVTRNQAEKFHFKNSVFNSYKHETPKTISSQFEKDFNPLVSFIRELIHDDEKELSLIKELFEIYYCDLRNIFRYYASISGETCFTMTARGLDIFTVHTMILDYLDNVREKNTENNKSLHTSTFTLLQQDVENIFMSITSRMKRKSLTMSGFLLAIIKISVLKYSRKNTKNQGNAENDHIVKRGYLSVYIDKLLSTCVVPFAHRVYAEKFCREYLCK